MQIQHFFHKLTSTLSYVVSDNQDAVLIDPVLDFDLASGTYKHQHSQIIMEYLEKNNLNLHKIIETHVHADHLSDSQFFKSHYPNAKIGISQKVKDVRVIFEDLLAIKSSDFQDGEFDEFYKDQEVYQAGRLNFKVFATPGHTPADTSFLFGDHLFVGDSLFMPDFGSGRCDFPGGSAEDSYHSIMNIIYKLPDHTQIYVGHDYSPGGREMKFQTTVAESKKENIRLNGSTTKQDFVNHRNKRDSELAAPSLLWPSLQVNLYAGKFPNGSKTKQYLKIPFKLA